jgi:DNA polymerase III alpha subunit
MNEYSIANGKIVAPISAIKSVGPAVVREAVAKGPFESLEDYMTRIDHSRINIGAISALIKARAADDLMDNSIEDYVERRKAFMAKYLSLRKSKTEFKPEMYELDPINVFLQEKEYNQSFNKSLLSDKGIVEILSKRWPGLKATNHKGFPFRMQSGDNEDTWVLNGVKVAEALVNKEPEKEFGMVLLFESSNYKSGISKKGRPWHKVSIMLSDGFNTIEATKWDQKKAYYWPKDTIVYIRGQLKPGWKTPVSITVEEIEKVEQI